jgi:hypothetical protein
MPRSITSVFSEAEDFAVAMREQGCLALLVTGAGQFRARLTQIALHSLRLSATDEQLPRIAFVASPADTILISLPMGRGPAPIWGGNTIGAGEIMTLGAGQRLHMRTDGPCRWGSIWLPAAELAQYGSAVTGAPFPVPSAAPRWHPRPATMRHLRHLHSAAIGLAERRSSAVIDAAAAHGLEQQLIDALIECFSGSSAIETTPATREHQDVALRLETLLQTHPEQYLRTAQICSAIDVSTRALRLSCEEQLGMGPTEYIRRRRIRLAPRV